MNKLPTSREELALNMIFDLIGESRYDRTHSEYMAIAACLPPLKVLHGKINDRLQEMAAADSAPYRICHFKVLTRRLQRDGWIDMHRLMIHRTDEAYIKFILLGPGPAVMRAADYAAVVNEGFLKNRRPMLTRRNEGYGQ